MRLSFKVTMSLQSLCLCLVGCHEDDEEAFLVAWKNRQKGFSRDFHFWVAVVIVHDKDDEAVTAFHFLQEFDYNFPCELVWDGGVEWRAEAHGVYHSEDLTSAPMRRC